MANELALGAANAAKPKRQIVKAAAAKVAKGAGNIARRTGNVALTIGKKAGIGAVAVSRRSGRAAKRFVQENWKTIALHEGMSLGSHVGTFFADKKAEATYLPALRDSPVLATLAKPSNIIVAAEIVLTALSKGKMRAAIRELLRGSLHAKTGRFLHQMFEASNAPPQRANTPTRGVSGADDLDDETEGVNFDEPADEAEGVNFDEPANEAEGVNFDDSEVDSFNAALEGIDRAG